LFSKVREFWHFIRGVLSCAPLVFYTFLVFMLGLYIFACIAVEVIAKHPQVSQDADFKEHVEKYFGSLPKALLTLLRFACLDNTSEVYTFLVEKDPWLCLFFVPLIFTVSLVLFNLLGAVVFASTLDQNQSEVDQFKTEQAATWSQLISGLRDLFSRLDEDQSGQLSKEELLNIDPADMRVLEQALGGCISHPVMPIQVFERLDVDKSGEITIDEFFDGIRDMILDGTALDTKRMEKHVEMIHWRLKEMYSSQYELKMQVSRLSRELEVPKFSPRSATAESSPRESSRALQKTQMESAPKSSPSNRHSSREGLPGREKERKGTAFKETLPAPELEDLPEWISELKENLRQSWEHCLDTLETALQNAGKLPKSSPSPSPKRRKDDAPQVVPEGDGTSKKSSEGRKRLSSSPTPPAPVTSGPGMNEAGKPGSSPAQPDAEILDERTRKL